MTTEQRLERLERENRWMRRIGAVGVALIAACVFAGQGKGKEPQELTVRSLTMVDNDGRVRAKLGTSGLGATGSAGLTLIDSNGRPRCMFRTSDFDSRPVLGMFDEKLRARLSLGLASNGSPSLVLTGKGGKPRVSLHAASDDTTALRLDDKHRKTRVNLAVAADGSPALHLLDKDGQRRAILGVTRIMGRETGESTLTLCDATGTKFWQTRR